MAKCEKILIAGFAGAGKSSFLKEISLNPPVGWDFTDLDKLIVEKYGDCDRSLTEWIEIWGWDYFRELEFKCLKEWLAQGGNGVLALGGGTLNEDNFQEISNLAKILFLEVDFETSWRRVSMDPAVRPLALKGENYMRFLFEKRMKVFQRIPWKMVNSDGTELKNLAASFWHKIR